MAIGKIKSGWGVVRVAPWHFAGLFEHSADAEAKAAEMGGDYAVKFGDLRVGSDDFAWSDKRSS